MAKIGVLTYYNTVDNYGQVLQYLATQTYLQNRGHQVNLILGKGRRKNIFERVYKKLKFKVQVLLHKEDWRIGLTDLEIKKMELFNKWAAITHKQEKEHSRFFYEFKQKNFNIDKSWYEDILSNQYDAFCVGSDQTWSAPSEHYMLGWVKNKRKFAIAPSVGHRIYTDEEIDLIKSWLNDYDFITVRENNGISLLERAGVKNGCLVLDPTFLINKKDYLKYADNDISIRKPYVFIYMLGGEISVPVVDIVKHVKSKGYDVIYVESQGREEPIPKEYATVSQWIAYIDNSDYVITNSFHGMAFSIIFRKPFLTFPLVGLMDGMNGRINDLAKKMDYEGRIYKDSIDVLFEPIDWSTAEIEISNNREVIDNKLRSINL